MSTCSELSSTEPSAPEPSSTERLLRQSFEAANRYLANLDERPVMPTEEAIAALEGLRTPLPVESASAESVLSLLDKVGSPATVATAGGRFFGFVVGGALPVTVAANWLASAWDQNAGTWVLSPIAAELEEVAANWMLELLDLPREAAVGFVTGSTMGTFSSLAAARASLLRRLGYDIGRQGLSGAPLIRVVMSEEIHPTNVAALRYLRIGLDEIEVVPTDDQGRILVSELPELDETTILVLQAGNINSGSFDDFSTLCEAARKAGAWVHVDGAFGLWARASNKLCGLAKGVELADSWSIDGHKLLNLPQDSAIFICRDPQAVQDIFGTSATYLMRDARRQPNNLTPELSRRARGVEFWAALKFLGRAGVEELVDRTAEHAQAFAAGLRDAGYEVLNDVVLNQVVFASQDEDATRAALELIQASGVTWLGPTTWRGRFSMRISVSSWATDELDVERSLEVFAQAHSKVRAMGPTDG